MADLQRVDELGFADFVAMLLVETLDAIVASHTSQEERLRALASAAEQSIEEFTENITDEVVGAALVRLFPDAEGGTAVAAGAPPPSQFDLDSLGISLRKADAEGEPGTSSHRLTKAGVRRITEGVRTHLAAANLASIRRVALEGVPRVRVDGGVLRSKLTFSAVRREESQSDAAPEPARSGTGAAPVLRDLGLSTVSYLPVLQKGLLDSIASTRLTVSPAVIKPGGGTGGTGGGSTGEGTSTESQSTATIYGEVEIHFHTEV